MRSFRSQKGMGEGDVEARLDKRKLAAALAEEDRRQREDPEEEGGKKPDWMREAEEVSKRVKGGKRGFGTTEDSTEVTEEQLEAYRLKGRNNYEDPMANYVDKDE